MGRPVLYPASTKLGQAIQAARESRGLSRKALAEQAGISPHWVRIMEIGEGGVSPETAKGLTNVLGPRVFAQPKAPPTASNGHGRVTLEKGLLIGLSSAGQLVGVVELSDDLLGKAIRQAELLAE